MFCGWPLDTVAKLADANIRFGIQRPNSRERCQYSDIEYYIYIYMYVCMYVCMYKYIYIYIYIYLFIYLSVNTPPHPRVCIILESYDVLLKLMQPKHLESQVWSYTGLWSTIL